VNTVNSTCPTTTTPKNDCCWLLNICFFVEYGFSEALISFKRVCQFKVRRTFWGVHRVTLYIQATLAFVVGYTIHHNMLRLLLRSFVHASTYIHTHIHTHAYKHTYTRIQTYIHTHTSTHTHTYKHTFARIQTYIHMHIPYKYTYTCIQTHIHTYTNIHTHECKQTYTNTHASKKATKAMIWFMYKNLAAPTIVGFT